MGMPQKNERYTYADYCTWDNSERWELIDGVPYAMSPAPSNAHQSISTELVYRLRRHLEGKPCKVFHAPYDVRLNAADEDDTVVQPDLVVICDRSKIDDKGCKGAPDLIIEILSPSTSRHDRIVKMDLYQRSGVREYWMLDPDTKTLQVLLLENGRYVITGYLDEDTVPVTVLPGCEIVLKEVFAE